MPSAHAVAGTLSFQIVESAGAVCQSFGDIGSAQWQLA
jgi:hypothetical protein